MPFYLSNVDLQGFVFRKAGGSAGKVGGGGTPPGGGKVLEALVADGTTYEMLGVRTGIGGLSVGRVSDINLPDNTSFYKTFAGGEAAFEGGRVVSNIAPYDIEDFNSLSAGVIVAGRNVTFPPDTLMGLALTNDRGGLLGTPCVARYRVRRLSGGTQLGVDLFGNTSYVVPTPNTDIGIIKAWELDLTGDGWVDFSITANFSDSLSNQLLLLGTGRSGIWGPYSEITIEIELVSVEFRTGADLGVQLIPAEFVKNEKTGAVIYTVSVAYASELGNTVDSNGMVTNGIGVPLAEMPWLIHAPDATSKFLNSRAPVTQVISGMNGDHCCWLEGAGTVTLSGGATGVASDGVPITFDPAGMDVTFAVAGGPPDFVQVENNTNPTAPIFTEGAAVTRDKDAYAFDSANWDDTEGTFYCEVITTGTSDIVDHFLSYSGNMTLYDGTNAHSMAAALGTRKVGFVWGSGTMRLNVDGVWHSEGPYDGTMLQGAFDLFRDALVVGGIRGIKRWDSKDESIIDGLMA